MNFLPHVWIDKKGENEVEWNEINMFHYLDCLKKDEMEQSVISIRYILFFSSHFGQNEMI